MSEFSEAPKWARFKAQNASGVWCWYGAKPTAGADRWLGGRGLVSRYKEEPVKGDWRLSLISRGDLL